MTKNLTLGLILTCLTQMWALKNFCGFYLYQILCIAASYHCVQLHGKVMSQVSEKGKKPHFGSDFGPLDPNLGHHFFFQKSGFLRHYISWSAIIMYNIKKTNNSIFRKRSEGQMHWWRDKQTDQQSDFIGRYPIKVEHPKNNNLDYLINPTFRNIDRLFVLSFKNGNDHLTRDSFDEYYMSLVKIKDFNVLIDSKQ